MDELLMLTTPAVDHSSYRPNVAASITLDKLMMFAVLKAFIYLKYNPWGESVYCSRSLEALKQISKISLQFGLNLGMLSTMWSTECGLERFYLYLPTG